MGIVSVAATQELPDALVMQFDTLVDFARCCAGSVQRRHLDQKCAGANTRVH